MEELNFEFSIKLIIIITYIIYLIYTSINIFKADSFNMTPEPLSHQPLFKAAIMIPFVSFITFGMIAWIGHKPQLDAEGLNNFLNISKLPLALFSLAAPFGVLVNNIHRTIQTKAQINEIQKKNTSDIYYSHQKNIIELINGIKEKTLDFKVTLDSKNDDTYIASIIRPIRLYRTVFYKSTPKSNDFSFNFEFIYFTIKSMVSSLEILKNLEEHSKREKKDISFVAKELSNFIDKIDNVARLYQIDTFFRHKQYEIKEDTFTFNTIFQTESEVICIFVYYISTIQNIADILGFKSHTYPIFEYLKDKEEYFMKDVFKHPNFEERDFKLSKHGFKTNDHIVSTE
ncbi:hypothetical protein [Lelliottia aquatilis]|uniref:hypothetical protein n=1 Tax=Lelliottia aquatilis TaxID=2080838 RepID=UPI00192A77ED|nr:hypothetical protein [Lelliottia aquatilis]MBL5884803.1 hypothetical protein [Lelliottia aquatilis]